MKKYLLYFNVLLIALLVVFISCDGLNPEPAPDDLLDSWVELDEHNKIKVFKNLMSNSAAGSALQAQVVNTREKFTLNLYGTFDTERNPDKIRTLTFQKDNNDTTVFLLLNQVSGKLQTAYIAVKGVKQPWVIRHEYIEGNDNAVQVSFHEYDWNTQQGTLRYEALFENQNGQVKQTPIYGLRTGRVAGSGTDLAIGLGVGVLVAETAFYGSSVGIAAALPAVTAAAGGPLLAVGGAAIAVAIIADLLMVKASAAEIEPEDSPLPANTPETDPAMGQNNPTNNTPPSNCSAITFSASMDAEGSIMVWGVKGGTSPYQYSVSGSSFQAGEVFGNAYEDGSYLITIKDAKGCNGAAVVNLKREEDIANKLISRSPWKLTAYVAGGTDFFGWINNGNISCGEEGNLFNHKMKVIEGTYSFIEGSATRSSTSEYHKYNCETSTYDISYGTSGSSHEWKIDKDTGKFIILNDGEEVAWLSISYSDAKVVFSGTGKDINEDEETSSYSFTIEK